MQTALHSPPAKAASPLPRIGYIWDTPFKAGERHILRQVTGSRAFQPVVLCRRQTGDSSILSVPVLGLKTRPNPLWKAYRKYVLRTAKCIYNQESDGVLEAVRRNRLKLLHVFFGQRALAWVPALARVKVPVSISFHGVDVALCLRPDRSPSLAGLFAVVDCVMVRSKYMGDELIAAGCPPSKIWINRPGIPLEQFPYRARCRGEDVPLTFCQVGRLIPKKGLADTLRAFRIVRRELPGARLIIVGEGKLRSELANEARRLGIAESVHFLGFLEQDALLGVLHDAHVFLHPSVTTDSGDQEGIPNSMLEAMATGLAPIASRHAGIPEVVTDGRTGWLVDEHAPDQLARRMLWCARNPRALEEVGLAARQVVEREYSLRERMLRLDEKYLELTRRRS